MVSYSGSVAARTILQDNELWLQPSSLDGKAGSSGNSNTFGRAALAHRVAKPEVVLTTYEVLCNDVHVLSEVEWSSIILDQRQRSRVAAGKAQSALQELAGGHKVVLSSHGLRAGSEQLFSLLTYIRPGNYEDISEVVPGMTEPEQQVRCSSGNIPATVAGWSCCYSRLCCLEFTKPDPSAYCIQLVLAINHMLSLDVLSLQQKWTQTSLSWYH